LWSGWPGRGAGGQDGIEQAGKAAVHVALRSRAQPLAPWMRLATKPACAFMRKWWENVDVLGSSRSHPRQPSGAQAVEPGLLRQARLADYFAGIVLF
jgi:hypothetical protein